MEEVWNLLRWAWITIIAVYALFQLIAFRRLVGERRAGSRSVMMAMLIASLVSNCISLVSESSKADRIALMTVAACASIATAVLARMLAEQKNQLSRQVFLPRADG